MQKYDSLTLIEQICSIVVSLVLHHYYTNNRNEYNMRVI